MNYQTLTPDLKSGVSNFSAVSLPINREQSTRLLRQLKFWCECGIREIRI